MNKYLVEFKLSYSEIIEAETEDEAMKKAWELPEFQFDGGPQIDDVWSVFKIEEKAEK